MTTDPSSESPLSHRVMELEMQLMHLERTVSQLNEVILQQQQRIELLEKMLGRMQGEVGQLTTTLQERADETA